MTDNEPNMDFTGFPDENGEEVVGSIDDIAQEETKISKHRDPRIVMSGNTPRANLYNFIVNYKENGFKNIRGEIIEFPKIYLRDGKEAVNSEGSTLDIKPQEWMKVKQVYIDANNNGAADLVHAKKPDEKYEGVILKDYFLPLLPAERLAEFKKYANLD